MKETTVSVSRDDDSGTALYEVMDQLEKIGVKSEVINEHEDGMEVKFFIE